MPTVWEHRRGCVAAQQLSYVDLLGEVCPCQFLEEPDWSIKEAPLAGSVAFIHAGGERRGCFSMYEGFRR